MRKPSLLRLPQRPGAPWLLDLFCGAGGSAVGYWLAGFNVVGVDIAPQPRYPFTFVQADALDVLAGQIENLGVERFAVVHASPPCQHYSNTQRIRSNAHPDLIGQVRRMLTPTGVPYVIENVMGARRQMVGPIMLCGSMFPLRTYRHRLFESSMVLTPPRHPKHVFKQTKMGRAPRPGEFIHVVGNFSGVPAARRAMGIMWMTRDELKEAIPPAYTEYLGVQIRKELRMGRTHRTHLATGDYAARRNTRRRLRTEAERENKTAKQHRDRKSVV